MTDQGGKSLFDPDLVRDVLRRLEASNVDELDFVAGSARLSIRRAPGKGSGDRGLADHVGESSSLGLPVIAPLTGVFYSRPTPDQPVFVSVGDLIQPGQVVGLIETMKLFNEVTAEVGGEVIAIAAHEGDLVEAGSPLVYVNPRADVPASPDPVTLR